MNGMKYLVEWTVFFFSAGKIWKLNAIGTTRKQVQNMNEEKNNTYRDSYFCF